MAAIEDVLSTRAADDRDLWVFIVAHIPSDHLDERHLVVRDTATYYKMHLLKTEIAKLRAESKQWEMKVQTAQEKNMVKNFCWDLVVCVHAREQWTKILTYDLCSFIENENKRRK